MIFVKLINHEYKNEIIDVIKSFYGNEAVKFIEKDKPIDKDGGNIKITSEIALINGETLCISKYYNTKGFIIDEHEIIPQKLIKDKKGIKKVVKISLFKLLTRVTGKTLPWGILTGIRPVKIVHKLLEKGLYCDDIAEKLKYKYYVTDDRADLAIKVALNEKKFLKNIDKNVISMYAGIPFCTSRCYYCSFTSNNIEKYREFVTPYIEAIKKEISEISEFLISNDVKVQSIYIGGGTPTSINADDLTELIMCINEFWPHKEEFTCEAGRPDTIDEEKLIKMKMGGINRISINPQTMNDDTLKRIGRKHNSTQIIDRFNLARNIGFDNINMDMIIGLPGENLSHVKETTDEIIKLNPENITVHILAIKRASIFNEQYLKNNWNDEVIIKMADYTQKAMDKAGMFPYYLYRQKHMSQNLENVGYCKKGFECIYNIQIMEEKQSIVSFGADAVTKVMFSEENRIERQHNIKDLKLYIERIDEQIEKKLELLYELYGK